MLFLSWLNWESKANGIFRSFLMNENNHSKILIHFFYKIIQEKYFK